jgi:two-component system NarL family response regulator
VKKNPEAITVFVVDDHPVVREGIVAMIDQQPDLRVVGEASNGPDAVAGWNQLQPEIMLLDLELGSMCGLEVLQAIRAKHHHARVIVLTTYDLQEDIYQSVQLGACGYLLKDVPRLELLDSIRKVHRGEKVLPPTISAKLADRVSSEAPTPREIEVLKLLASGMANKEIADQLGVAPATVKSHVTSLMQKLGASSRTEAATMGRAKGWLRR